MLIHVGSSCCNCCLVLWWHTLGSNHSHCCWVSHTHLLTLALLMVGVWWHQACSRLGGLSLQCHLPLSVGYLLDLHCDFHCCRWRARGGLLLLLRKWRLALWLAGRLTTNTSRHDTTRLLLGRCCRAKDWFALGLVDWGGSWWSAGIWRQTVGVLLELLRVGPCSTLLLLLNLRKHLLLMLGRVHYPPSPTPCTAHLLKLVVKMVLRRHTTL